MSQVKFHIVYRNKLDELNEAQPYSKTPKTVTSGRTQGWQCPVNSSLADVASPFRVSVKTETLSLWGKTGLTPASDTFKDEHNDMDWREKKKIEKKRVNSVYSPLRCVRSLRETWRHHPWNKNWGFIEDGNQQWRWKMKKKKKNLQSQALKSLMKAAVAIFPLPTKYSQTFVKLRIYCCFTAYNKPKTKELKSFQYDSLFFFSL